MYFSDLLKMATSSKSRQPVFLIGKYEEDILDLKLPFIQKALGHFLYVHRQQKKLIREASAQTVQKIEQFWKRARISVRHKQDSIKKPESLFTKWQGLKKNSAGEQRHRSRVKVNLLNVSTISLTSPMPMPWQ